MQMSTSKKSKKSVSTKGVKKTAKKIIKIRVKNEALGREGTITRFMKERILAGEENAAILKAATKKFRSAKIGKGYPSWYRSQMKKQGLLRTSA